MSIFLKASCLKNLKATSAVKKSFLKLLEPILRDFRKPLVLTVADFSESLQRLPKIFKGVLVAFGKSFVIVLEASLKLAAIRKLFCRSSKKIKSQKWSRSEYG